MNRLARPALAASMTLLGLLTGLSSGIAHGAEDRTPAARAEDLWTRRAEGSADLRPAAALIERMVAAHEEAVAAEPNRLDLQWKLLRALHFQGEYVLTERSAKLELFERARRIADEARETLAERVGHPLEDLRPREAVEALVSVPDAAPIYFYSAVHWGLWGENTGRMRAARQGVADKLRDFAEVVILLEETFDGAGGRRFLGRLHTEAPKIPLVTGWVDRARAIDELERASRLAPEEPFNRLYLADALLRFDRRRRAEALRLLETLASEEPRPSRLIEDSAAIAGARKLLADQRL